MKKLIAAALAAALALSLSCTAFAATVDQDTNPPKADAIVSTEIAPTYTVTIPSEVTLGNSADISAENVVLEEGKQLEISLTATSSTENAFTVTNGGAGVLTYEVTSGSTPVALGDKVLTVNPSISATGSTTLNFSNPTNMVQFSGSYAGTVTFTVAVIAGDINFTINGAPFTAKTDMTWAQWVNDTAYNTVGAQITYSSEFKMDIVYFENKVGTSSWTGSTLANNDMTAPLDTSEAIISGKSYCTAVAWR